MAQDWQTCRLCHKASFEDRRTMVQTGTRHWAHWQCKFDSLPDRDARISWLQSLPKHRLVTAPFLLLDNIGLYEFVSNWVRELEREENMKALKDIEQLEPRTAPESTAGFLD